MIKANHTSPVSPLGENITLTVVPNAMTETCRISVSILIPEYDTCLYVKYSIHLFNITFELCTIKTQLEKRQKTMK